MELRISRVRPSELPALRDLAEHTFRVAWADDNDPEEFERYCETAFAFERLEAELAEPGSEFYFAWSDDRPVAYLKINFHTAVAGSDQSENVQIERIYVLDGFQGQQIGRRLLDVAEDRARAVGATWLWLSVWQESPRSIQFYLRYGFEIFGTDTFWLGNEPQTDWLMKRRVG